MTWPSTCCADLCLAHCLPCCAVLQLAGTPSCTACTSTAAVVPRAAARLRAPHVCWLWPLGRAPPCSPTYGPWIWIRSRGDSCRKRGIRPTRCTAPQVRDTHGRTLHACALAAWVRNMSSFVGYTCAQAASRPRSRAARTAAASGCRTASPPSGATQPLTTMTYRRRGRGLDGRPDGGACQWDVIVGNMGHERGSAAVCVR